MNDYYSEKCNTGRRITDPIHSLLPSRLPSPKMIDMDRHDCKSAARKSPVFLVSRIFEFILFPPVIEREKKKIIIVLRRRKT